MTIPAILGKDEMAMEISQRMPLVALVADCPQALTQEMERIRATWEFKDHGLKLFLVLRGIMVVSCQ